ncbi:MAG: hypothetical protein QOK21_1708 [Solirubrobacteraceae bacterium]|nr:hypothetical protein [Solirubrobacteraceae bacterium]
MREIRAWWQAVRPPPGLLKRLEPVYYVFITLAIGGPFVYGTASAALADVTTPRAVAHWGPGIALVALLAAVRWGAVQGPVVFSVPDVAQLLGAPLRRAELALGRLARGLAIGAAGAGVLAGITVIGIASDGRSLAAARAAGFVVGLALLGVLGVAGASLVQGSRRWDRTTRLAAWPVLAVAAGLIALAGSGTAGHDVALWCGPWGWAIQPVAGAAGAWPAALALLAAVAAAATALALARRGRTSTERHLVRAEARGGAVAALYSMNARYARRSLSSVGSGPAAVPRARLRPPRSARWAIAWRDAVAALAVPQRLGEALVLAAGGTLVALLNATHPVAVGAGALAVYAGAARLLEPLRAETDKPGRARVLLLAPIGRVLAEHALVPVVVVLAGALAAVAGCALAGALPVHGGAVATLAVLATPSIVLCAALSSRRGGRLPASVMAVTYVDTTGSSMLIVLLWIIAFPVLAIGFGALPVSVAARHGTSVLPQFAVLLACAPLVLLAGLRWERFAP